MANLKVTIGVPAYNEEANIRDMLERILVQEHPNFELFEIIVASDGSSDKTVLKAKEVADTRIIVKDYKERVGKTQRINNICAEAKGDVVVIIDADILPTSSNTLALLIEPFNIDAELVYASGALKPINPHTFIEEAFIVSRSVWDKLRLVLKNGESIYTCHGALYALRTDFAKTNPYPTKLWTDIGFYYLTCLQQNKKYKSVKSASVYFKLPTTVKDYLSQVKRYHREGISIKEYFGDWVNKEYFIPKTLLYKYKFEVLLRYPVHCLAIFALNLYSKYLSGKAKANANANWSMVNSTKVLNNYEV